MYGKYVVSLKTCKLLASLQYILSTSNVWFICVLYQVFCHFEAAGCCSPHKSIIESPEGVKWELGLAGFALGKRNSSHNGTGIWSLGMGKKC